MFIEMSYLGGDTYMSEEVEDVRQKENDQCKKNMKDSLEIVKTFAL